MTDRWLKRFQKEAIPKIVAEFKPDRVLLFGSRVRGTANKYSDALAVRLRIAQPSSSSLDLHIFDAREVYAILADGMVTYALARRLAPVFAAGSLRWPVVG